MIDIIEIKIEKFKDKIYDKYIELFPKDEQRKWQKIESTYTWNKKDFYIVDKPSNKINPGYSLNTISINKKLNKYFTDITKEDKVMLQENESDVVEFITNSFKNQWRLI